MIWQRSADFNIKYQNQDAAGIESDIKDGRLEVVDQGFYLNVSDVPKRAYVSYNQKLCLEG